MSEQPDTIGIFFTIAKNSPPVLAQLYKHYSTLKNIESGYITIDDLKSKVDGKKKCIVIFSIIDSESANEFMAFSRLVRERIQSRNIIPIALVKSSGVKVEKLLEKSGCAEILTFSVSTKTILYKVNRHLKVLELKEEELINLNAADLKPKVENVDFKEPTLEIISINPVESKVDFWLLANKSHAKKYLHNWLVEMIGPSPSAGAWKKTNQHHALFKKGELWEWVAHGSTGLFHTEEGRWVFEGNSPEYNWNMNRWAFVGPNVQLSFVQNEKIIHLRFRAKNQHMLEIAENSSFGIAAFDTIKLTYDLTRKFSQDESKIPWNDKTNSADFSAKDWNKGDLSSESPNNEADFLKFLLEIPGYKTRGILNDQNVELLGFGEEKNVMFLGMPHKIAEEQEQVSVKLVIDKSANSTVQALECLINKIHEIEKNRYIAKVTVLEQSISSLEKIKKTFVERQNQATSFIKQAKGIESKESIEDKIKNEEMTREFLKNNHILIIDAVSSARVSLASLLIKLGAVRNKMSLVGSLEEASAEQKKTNAKVIFSDYMIGNKSGFEFIQKMKTEFERAGIKDSISFLVTSNASQSSVARAAEEDIDNFVIKPYPFDNLKKAVIESVQAKLNPSTYVKLVNDGKEYLDILEYEKAKECFTQAIQHNPAPALALSYLGALSVLNKDFAQAEKFFNGGLTFNEIHFRCMIGLHELLFEQKRYVEAYKVAKLLVKYFPANSKRLSNVLRAAIVTDNFQDILEFYKVFLEIDERTEELVRYVCSALVVAGKNCLNKKDIKGALDLFEKASISAVGKTHFILYIVETLVNHKMTKESQSFVKRLNTIAPTSEDYLAANFLASTLTLPSIDIVNQGRQLIKNGLEVPSVYEKLIIHSQLAGYQEAAEELVNSAITRWPDKKDLFKALINDLPNSV